MCILSVEVFARRRTSLDEFFFFFHRWWYFIVNFPLSRKHDEEKLVVWFSNVCSWRSIMYIFYIVQRSNKIACSLGIFSSWRHYFFWNFYLSPPPPPHSCFFFRGSEWSPRKSLAKKDWWALQKFSKIKSWTICSFFFQILTSGPTLGRGKS